MARERIEQQVSSEEKRRAAFAAIATISSALAGVLKIEDVLGLTLEQLADALALAAGAVLLLDEDLQLTLEKGHLIIKGEVKPDAEVNGTYMIRERRPGIFGRVIALPSEVEAGAIDASFSNGVLTVTLPKAESVKPKQIKIRAN